MVGDEGKIKGGKRKISGDYHHPDSPTETLDKGTQNTKGPN
jgi:hypothetical protein